MYITQIRDEIHHARPPLTMTKWQERPAEKHPDWEQPQGAPRQPCRQALANQVSPAVACTALLAPC